MGRDYRWELGSRNESSKRILGTVSSVCCPNHRTIEDEGRY